MLEGEGEEPSHFGAQSLEIWLGVIRPTSSEGCGVRGTRQGMLQSKGKRHGVEPSRVLDGT